MSLLILLFLFCMLVSCARCGMAEASSIEVKSPGEYQVFQRDHDGVGHVSVCCKLVEDGLVEARVVDSQTGREVVAWQPLGNTSGHEYKGEIEVPAGGMYCVEFSLSAESEDRAVAGKVENVGVGDVFICAGQSNSANSGSERMQSADRRVCSYDGRRWSHCDDPQNGATGDGGSPWPILGDMLVINLDIPVAFASIGVGASSIEEWLPDTGKYYPRLVSVLRRLGKGGAKAILWHQGEQNVMENTGEEEYFNKVAETIARSRIDAGYDIDWFTARASYCPDIHDEDPRKLDAVRNAQERLWREGKSLRGPDTDDLTGEKYRAPDRIHMNGRGLVAHAQRWFACLWTNLYTDRCM